MSAIRTTIAGIAIPNSALTREAAEFVRDASAVEVAEQVGNAPTMTYDTYSHVIAEAKGGERLSAEAAIKAAREHGVSGKCPPDDSEAVSLTAKRL